MKSLLPVVFAGVASVGIISNAHANDAEVKEKSALMMYQRISCSVRFSPEQNTWMRVEAERLIGSNDITEVSTYLATLAGPLFREKDAQARYCEK
jgi:hypothetical protein